MPKLDLKIKYIFLIFAALFFTACEDNSKDLKSPLSGGLEIYYDNPIDFINSIRTESRLNTLYPNDLLSKTSLNHATYTFKNDVSSHDELIQDSYFTGTTPQERAYFVGYDSQVMENISTSSIDPISSVEGLMSAIYHRFAFLNPTINEIGYGEFGNGDFKNYVYTMGNSNLEQFCKTGISDKGYGKFYSNFCKNKEISISEKNLNQLKYVNYFDYIYYPNSQNTKPFFSKEIPDPIPECKITSNPVSIEFNTLQKPVTLVNFKIYKDGNELQNTQIITQLNDINSIFNKFQFAVFSKEVFDFDQEYFAVFEYIQNSVQKKVSWKFKTKIPQNHYFIANDGDKLALLPNRWYDIFIKPQNCNDVFDSYTASYKLMKKPEIKTIDTNMLRVRLNGMKNSKLTLKLNNNKEINLVLTQSSDDFKIYENKLIYVIIIVILVFLIYIIIRKRR